MSLNNAFLLLHKWQSRGKNDNLFYNYLFFFKKSGKMLEMNLLSLFPKQETLILWQHLIRMSSFPLLYGKIDRSQAEAFCPVGTIGVEQISHPINSDLLTSFPSFTVFIFKFQFKTCPSSSTIGYATCLFSPLLPTLNEPCVFASSGSLF